MKTRLLIFTIASIAMTSLALADAAPGPGPIMRPPIIIRPIPQPQPQVSPNDQFIAQLANGNDPTVLLIPRDAFAPTPHADASGVSPVPTIVAGFALSAALTVGGLQLARGKRRNGAILLVAAGIGISMIARALYAADTPAPADTGHHGPVEVDLTSQSTVVHVTLSRDLAAFLTADALGNN